VTILNAILRDRKPWANAWPPRRSLSMRLCWCSAPRDS